MAYVQNASTKAYKFILSKIEQGEWRPGDRIWTEARLCEHLGVSRIALRQATEKLVALSILYKIQGSGTYVCDKKEADVVQMGFLDVGEDDILDILEFRSYFEPGNIALFVKNAQEEDIAALEESYASMREAVADNDMIKFTAADYLFHDIIAKGTKKRFIYRISTTLNSVMTNHQLDVNTRIGPDIGLEFHALILDSVKKRDKDLAALFMKRHIDATIKAVKKALQESAEDGKLLEAE